MSFLRLLRNGLNLKATFSSFGGFGGSGSGGGAYQDIYGYNYRPLSGSQYDYKREAGLPWENSAVMACVRWAVRQFPEAVLKVQRKRDYGWEYINHAALDLLMSPNKDYESSSLWNGLVTSYMLDGNAFFFAEKRLDIGWPTALYYIPHFQINPRFNTSGREFITDYIYRTGKTSVSLPKDSILHIRDGLSLDNTRRGASPLQAVLREICADNEASTAAAAIMRNLGVPGITFTPAADIEITPEEMAKLREMSREKLTGDRRGEMLMMPIPGKIDSFGFEPEKLALDKIRRVPEERISSVLGIPAVVVGLGAGLDRSTFSNFHEAREAAYESCMVPMWRVIAEQLTHSLLPMFDEDPSQVRFHFDISEVRALGEDENKRHERIRMDYKEGIIKRNEAKVQFGYTYPESSDWVRDDVYIQDLPKVTEKLDDSTQEAA